MQADGAIDENCLGDFLDELIEQGANGVVIAGTTGESPTLSMHEHRQLIAFAIKSVGGRIPVIAGVGANATAESVELTKNAQADVPTPDYRLFLITTTATRRTLSAFFHDSGFL